MADTFKYVQAQSFSLAGGGAIAGATSITLKSFAGIDGALLTMTDFGTIGFMTLEPGNGTLEEQISFTGVTQNSNGTATITGVSNVTFISPYTVTSGTAKTHAGSTTAIVSNTSGFYDRLTGKADDETITGLWDFPSGANNPTIGNVTYVAPTTDTQIATKKYVDTVAVSGAPDATTTAKGIVEIATQAEVDAKTATGSTAASLVATPALARSTLLSDYVADTGSANAYAIAPSPVISAYVTGQRFIFRVTNSNTTASTIAVNGLSATAIFKNNGSTALASGDLIAGQVIEVVKAINGFQLETPAASTINYSGGAYPAASGAAITSINGANITANTIPAYSTTNLVYQSFDQSNVGSSTTAEQTVYSFTINGGVLGSAGGIQMQAIVQQLRVDNGGQTGTIRFKYGATTMATLVLSGVLAYNEGSLVQIHLGAGGTTATQNIQIGIPGTGGTGGSAALGTATEDSTASKTFAITIQFSDSDAQNVWAKRSIQVAKL